MAASESDVKNKMAKKQKYQRKRAAAKIGKRGWQCGAAAMAAKIMWRVAKWRSMKHRKSAIMANGDQ